MTSGVRCVFLLGGKSYGKSQRNGDERLMRSTITVIDFGTSKVVALVAEVTGRQRTDIIGAGRASYDGFADARWNNPDLVNDTIAQAVRTAEEQARTNTREVFVGVPGQFSRIYTVEVKLDLQGADPHVTSRDIETLFALANEEVREVRGTPIHRSPAWFVIDDGKKTLEPLNRHGNELRAMISYVIADQFFIDDVSERLRAIGKSASGFFSTPMGEAMLYISDEERDRTALLIDTGYLATEVMAVEGDTIIFHKNIPLGGGHITADLTYGLDIPLDQAEQIKRSYIFGAPASQPSFDILGTDGRTQTFAYHKVSEILDARAEEICDEIASCVKESGVRLGNWSVVYLTGGGLAINRGGREFLSERLGRPVRDLPRKAVKLSSPIYSSALGLLDLIIDTRTGAGAAQGGLGAFFRNLFGG